MDDLTKLVDQFDVEISSANCFISALILKTYRLPIKPEIISYMFDFSSVTLCWMLN